MEFFNKKSLKSQVREYLNGQIASGKMKPGDKLPAQRELSATLGVSKRIADIALRELELENVIFRRVGKGSFLLDKENLPTRFSVDSDTILIVVPTLRNPVFSAFVEEVERRLSTHGKLMRVGLCQSLVARKKYYLSMLEKEGAAGVIGISLPEFLCEYASNNHIPLVNVGTEQSGSYNQIVMDLRKAGLLMAEYFLRTGNEVVACAGCFPYGGKTPLDIRFMAICEFLGSHGVEVSVVPQSGRASINMDYETIGFALIEQILRMKRRPTAIAFYNDARAMGGMKALRQKGFSIPEDFSVAGFDNIFSSSLFSPSLTTIDSGYEQAAALTVEMIVNKATGRKIVLEPKLIIRESTRK